MTTSDATALPDLPSRVQSPTKIFLTRMLRNRAAMVGAFLLFILYFTAIFGSFIGPYNPGASNPNRPNHAPTKIHFSTEDGSFTWPPFIHDSEMTDVLRRQYEPITELRYPIRLFVKGEPYKLWGLFDCETHLYGLGAPIRADGSPVSLEELGEAVTGDVMNAMKSEVRIYVFGSDSLGRDIFSRILSGAKISLSVGLIGILITMTLGLLVGGISGYAGGITDALLMRFVELIMSIPGLYLILALRAALSEQNPLLHFIFRTEEGQPLNSSQIYLLIIVILALVSWGGTARVIRGMVLSIKKLDYVAAARAMGASPLRIIVKHLLPNTFTYVIISATLSIPSYILGEVALSFLGVGIEEPQASWGNMLNEAQNLGALVSFPWVLIPGFFIFLTVFAFNFFGDGVRDSLDPRYLK